VDFIDRWLRGEDPDLAPHLLLVGRTGSGKTTAARAVLHRTMRSGLFDVVILDWDAEYDDLPLPVHAPPFPIAAPPSLVADALAEVERSAEGGHGVAYFLKKAITGAASLERAAEKLRTQFDVTSYALRAAIEAAVTRLEMLMQYIEFENTNVPASLGEGVYLLSEIPSVWARASIQQFLSAFHVFANRRLLIARERDPLLPPVPPSILVIEEGGMGARSTYLYHLMREARKARTRIIYLSQTLPPAEILQSAELLLFDTNWQIRKELRAPIPDSELRPGECWWVRRAGAPKKLRFRIR
jgi:DNA polymerase III delta prime subunit